MAKDFKAGFNKMKNTSEKPRTEMTTHIPKTKKKMGRPTTKDSSIKYVRVSVDMPEDMRADLKSLLYSSKFRGQFPTQNDFILSILNDFIETHN